MVDSSKGIDCCGGCQNLVYLVEIMIAVLFWCRSYVFFRGGLGLLFFVLALSHSTNGNRR